MKNYFLVLLFLCINTAYPQHLASNRSTGDLVVADISNAFDVGVASFAQPFNYDSNNWLTVGTIIGGTALLFTVDKDVRKYSLDHHSDFNNSLFSVDNYYGNAYTAILSGGLYGIGLISSNQKIREMGLQTTEAFVISGLITALLKITIGRRRPYAGESNTFFKPFQISNNIFQALPSGHTTVAFAVSTVMANSIDNIFWKSFWYGTAGMVALSRIYNNKHWASDVFLGSAIGYFVGKFIFDYNNLENTKSPKISIAPIVSFGNIGLRLNF